MKWLSKLFGSDRADGSAERWTLRDNNPHRSDAAFDAWTSGDLSQMLRALETPTHPVDRHYLLQTIVELTYKERNKAAKMRQLCEKIARIHINEFPLFVQPLLAQNKDSRGIGFLPRISTFQHLATILTENEQFDEARTVCELAIKYDLHDNTQGGFEKRIERIRNREKRARSDGT